MFTKLRFQAPNAYHIDAIKNFEGTALVVDGVLQCLDFAFSMSFGQKGHHRNHRSGGTEKRKKGEIFINAFQGKLAEFAFYTWLQAHKIPSAPPSFDVWGTGIWDTCDFEVKNLKVCIKSAAHFASLLLLECQDWDDFGAYKPNLQSAHAVYDLFVFLRIKPDGKTLMRQNRLLFSNQADYETLKSLLLKEHWYSELCGFATWADVIEVINQKQIIPQKALLNGKTLMDADNYYIHANDLKSATSLKALLWQTCVM
ncbi:hypothetical protein [Pelobium manganitolerans]|uniref:hypothetical protein n=1 Tax=Pelobium manganitolerans TaxID=1842495 RepID=UPI003FA3C837